MIGNSINRKILFLLIFIASAVSVFSSDVKPFSLIPISAQTQPVIDGILDDSIWASEPQVTDTFISYYPADGTKLPQITRVWVAYDSENLYFAFNCLDSDSRLLKTSITRRDEIGGDDWVGVGLDSIGNKQNLYEFIVNPNGIQYDGLVFPNGAEDKSADWV